MSDLSREARRKNRAKAYRIANAQPGSVDCSSYGPEENLQAGVKTGMRPVSRRQYKDGGTVSGEDAKPNAGRAARASGGKTVAEGIANVNMKEANQDRDGPKKIGGLKRGGRAARSTGGDVALGLLSPGGLLAKEALGLKKGGRAARSTGGDVALGLLSPGGLLAKEVLGKKRGGSVSDGTFQGTRPTGGRLAKASGGKMPYVPGGTSNAIADEKARQAADTRPHVKRNGLFAPSGPREGRKSGGRAGKTNINIIIGRSSPSGQPDAPGPLPTPGGPGAMPVPVGPPPLGAMGAAVPGGPPPGAGAPPPMMPPPMGRKSGGRTMRGGAGGGLARLEKMTIAKKDRGA